MRIVFTTHTYYPSRDGVAIVNDYLTRGLAQKGHEVIIVTHKVQGQPDEEDYNGVRIYRKYEDTSDAREYVDFVTGLLGAEDVLINVCTQTPTTDLILPHLKNIHCKKKILYVHGIWHFGWEARNRESLHNILSKIYNNAKWRRYYNHYKRCFKEKFGIESHIMENAADPTFFDNIDADTNENFIKEYNIPERYLLCVANYGKAKNQEFVLRAYYESASTDELIFIGKDSTNYIEHLKEVESSLHVDKDRKKVRYLTDIPREKISLFVRNAYIFLFGSIGEKFPMSIVEPMAAGVPYISTDVGIVKYFPGGEVVDTPNEMALILDRFINDENCYKCHSKDGRNYAYEHMRQDDKIDDFERIITTP